MNLRARFILLAAALFVVSASVAWFSMHSQAESIVEQWGVRYAQQQVRLDKARSLQPILREIKLSRQLARAPAIKEWALHPRNPTLRKRGLATLENYRQFFSSHSYFLALRKDRRYYYNNAADAYAGKQFRYRLKPGAAKDAWFFDMVRDGRHDVHINVNPDPALGVTKLWIDVLVNDGDRVLGIVGTGLNLQGFLRHSVDNRTPGMSTFFVDDRGAIQLARDRGMIDYASITKRDGEHKTIGLLFPDRHNQLAVQKTMERARKAQGSKVVSSVIDSHGHRLLVSIAYLPRLNWYEINRLDLARALPDSRFTGVGIVFLLVLVAALTVFYLLLGRLVIDPLRNLERAMLDIEDGREVRMPRDGRGEIGRLMQHCDRMTQALLGAKHDLETKVAQRTRALERLSQRDPLTGLLNRRGMTERIKAELSRIHRTGGHLALLWIDVDHFKSVNDRYGHAVGDQALKQVAKVIRQELRSYDVAARWGGDEFLVLLGEADLPTMNQVGSRLNARIGAGTCIDRFNGKPIALTVSIGGYLAVGSDDLDDALIKADCALYAVKQAGRDGYQAYEPSLEAHLGQGLNGRNTASTASGWGADATNHEDEVDGD